MIRSTTLRLTLMFGAAATILGGLVGLLAYRTVSEDLRSRQIAQVRADFTGFAELYEQRRIIALRQTIARRTEAPEQMILLLLGKDGVPLAGNVRGWPATVEAVDAPFEDIAVEGFRFASHDGTPHRYLGLARNLPGGFPLLIARAQTDADAVLARLAAQLLLGAVFLAVLGLATGFVLSRMVLTRIERVNALCLTVEQGDLDARIPGPRSTDEFGRLESHVHAMLDRIVVLNRSFVRLGDHIAHELRTPLNRIRQKIRRLDEPQSVVEIEAEIEETVRIFDALLDIASTESGAGTAKSMTAVDLASVVDDVHDLYDAVAEEKGVSFSVQHHGSTMVLGERDLLVRLVVNLVDNAVKFTPAGGKVTLGLVGSVDSVVMSVEDTGPGIAPRDVGRIFERFERVGDRQRPGHGLGLALVRAIAARHGAKISVDHSGGGFSIQIRWPSLISGTGGH